MNSPPSTLSPHQVAQGIASAMSQLRVDGFAELYATDMVIWHNHENKTQTREENLQLLAELFKLFKHLKYVDIRRELTESGYVQQHILSGEFADGRLFAMPCCHIAQVRDGKLTRIDEYFDPAPLYALMGESAKE